MNMIALACRINYCSVLSTNYFKVCLLQINQKCIFSTDYGNCFPTNYLKMCFYNLLENVSSADYLEMFFFFVRYYSDIAL